MSLARLASFGLILILNSVADAQLPERLAFQGVVPGMTGEADLLANAARKPLLSSKDLTDGSKVYEFKFGIWSKVTALVRGGVVQMIDVTPPERALADRLAEVWELAKSKPVDRRTLPAGIWMGPTEVESSWQILQSDAGAPVLFFTAQDDPKQYVRQARFYPAPAAPEKLYVSKAGRCAVLMMGEPKDLPKGAFFPVEKAIYTMVFTDHPDAAANNTDPERILDQDRDRRIGSVGRLITERKIRLDSYPGRDFWFEFPFGDEPHIYRKYLFLVGDRLYHVVVSAPKAEGLPHNTEQFLNSFRLVR